MRIAILSEYFYPDNSGGTPSDISELAAFIKKAHNGVEIDVITSKNLYRPTGGVEQLPSIEHWAGLSIKRVATPKSNRESTVMRLIAGAVFAGVAFTTLSFRRRYDLVVIVTNPPANGFAAWLYSSLFRVPYVYIVHDLYPDIAIAMRCIGYSSSVARVARMLQSNWLKSAAAVVVLGRCMKSHIANSYHIDEGKIAVVPSWGNPDLISVGSRANEFRARHRLTGFVVLYAGNFSEYVNFEQILGAAQQMKDDAGVTFVLIGDGVKRCEVVAMVEREGLGNVKVLEKVPRPMMNEVLAASDIAIVPLDRRMAGLGVPSKFYTVLASGRPVLALMPEACEVARIVREESCGVCVSGADSKALVECVSRLAGEPELVRTLGANARAALERRFTLAHAAQAFYRVFERVGGESLV